NQFPPAGSVRKGWPCCRADCCQFLGWEVDGLSQWRSSLLILRRAVWGSVWSLRVSCWTACHGGLLSGTGGSASRPFCSVGRDNSSLPGSLVRGDGGNLAVGGHRGSS